MKISQDNTLRIAVISTLSGALIALLLFWFLSEYTHKYIFIIPFLMIECFGLILYFYELRNDERMSYKWKVLSIIFGAIIVLLTLVLV